MGRIWGGSPPMGAAEQVFSGLVVPVNDVNSVVARYHPESQERQRDMAPD